MERIAVSISHEADYAVAIAFGIRAAGGRYVFPLDIDERLDERERRILARLERLRSLAAADPPGVAAADPPRDGPGDVPGQRAEAPHEDRGGGRTGTGGGDEDA